MHWRSWCSSSHSGLRAIHPVRRPSPHFLLQSSFKLYRYGFMIKPYKYIMCTRIIAFLLRIVVSNVSILCGDASPFLMKEKVIKNTNLLGEWGGRGSLTLLTDEFKKSKLGLGLKELRFKNSHQVSYKGGLWEEIIWYSLILWFFHSKNWSIFNEIRARIFEKLQHKKFIMARLSKGNHQWCESEYTGHNLFHLDCLPSATYCMAAPIANRIYLYFQL